MAKQRTLKNANKAEKIQYCENDVLSSCKVFLFIVSDLKLVQIAFIDAASYLPPFNLLWCHSVVCDRGKNHAAVVFAPFLLILLKSRPTDDETFL